MVGRLHSPFPEQLLEMHMSCVIRALDLVMVRRTTAIVLACVGLVAPGRADSLVAQLFPLSGEVRLRNASATPVSFAFYQIDSASSGSLNPSSLVWKSISGNYDVNGNGFIDPANAWTKISAVSTQLTEGVFSGPGGSLTANRAISLGQIWNAALPFDLAFTIQHPDTTPVTVTTQFAVAGDYDSNGTVNSFDYIIWRQNFGSTTSLNADGDLNGVVDATDYDIWRSNLGRSLPGAGSGAAKLALNGAVPEPAIGFLLVCGTACLALIGRGRGRRAARCG